MYINLIYAKGHLYENSIGENIRYQCIFWNKPFLHVFFNSSNMQPKTVRKQIVIPNINEQKKT
jgi:hypothetical protein